MSLYFSLQSVENNKNKKSVKFQGDMLNFCDFIQIFVFTTNHHLKSFEIIVCTLSMILPKNTFGVFILQIRNERITPWPVI